MWKMQEVFLDFSAALRIGLDGLLGVAYNRRNEKGDITMTSFQLLRKKWDIRG